MKRADVIIIGAGSTGLILAKLLELAGFSVIIVEKRKERGKHSRAIGIHPPGLKILHEIGILDEFLIKGVSVTKGLAHVGPKFIGSILLASGRKSFDRVLTIPQYRTEELIEQTLQSTRILRGWTLSSLSQRKSGVQIEITSGVNIQNLECTVLIGADGMYSTVRSLLGIPWSGTTYPYKYAMADVSDNTDFGSQAAIFLSSEGLTESFPMPGGVRRWVVNHKLDNIDTDIFFELIRQRTLISPDMNTLSMFSEFEIHQYRAERMYLGNTLLVGDALGVMSPIGGQAMSLHWLHAKELVDFLIIFRDQIKTGSLDLPSVKLEKVQSKHLKRLTQYSNRSHFNTVMGLPGKPNWLLKGVSQALLSPGVKNYWSRRFSMRDLK